MRIPIIRPDISFEEVADDIAEVLKSGILTRGPKLASFERAMAEYLGVASAVATTSATTALHLSLVALGIGPGDEVLVSDFTFPASGNVIVQTGATPVLIDCLPGRFDLDPSDAIKKINSRTRVIMPVDPFGQPADLDAVHSLARDHDLAVVEDAACALGARRGGRLCGTWPGATCFSFHPRKVLTTGEGGMIVTNDINLAERLRLLRNHGGRTAVDGTLFVEHGFNYRMSEIQAVLGLAQLRHIDAVLADRRRTAAEYHRLLTNVLPELTVPLAAPFEDCTFQSFVVVLPEGIDRARIIRLLAQHGIEATLGTYAMHAHPAFAHFGYRPGDLPRSWDMQRRSLTLPLLPRMSSETVEEVVNALVSALRE
jgi:dTDP-4-amino-4,6-dideoxygalactose transaminase